MMLSTPDPILHRVPPALPGPVVSGWPVWALRAARVLRRALRDAAARRRSRQALARLHDEVQHLDDRLLLDAGIVPRRLAADELAHVAWRLQTYGKLD